MITYNKLLGLPVFLLNKMKVGVIRDIFYCYKTNVILGLIIDEKSYIKKYRYIPLDEIEQIENTKVVIKDIGSLKDIEKWESLYGIRDKNLKCTINSGVCTKDGNKVGKVKDIIFNFEIGLIEGYIISYGFIDDLIDGRKIITNNFAKQNNNKLVLNKKNIRKE